MRIAVTIRALAGVLALWGLGTVAQADIFVYQLPGGARIVTDHALNNRDYKLVRHSRTTKGAGALVSTHRIQYAVTDPTAYDRLIRRTANAHKLDESLIKAVMHVESAFNPHAVSDKGAQGLMQLMPETAQRYGAQDLFDPAQNVRAGALYLKDLQKQFKNNLRLVLAAYNAGENAVLRYKGVPPYDETRDYVRKVMKMHRAYLAERQAATKVANAAAAAKPAAAVVPAPSVLPAPALPGAQTSAAGFVPVAAVQPAGATPPEKNL
jgi:hypothetical protein